MDFWVLVFPLDAEVLFISHAFYLHVTSTRDVEKRENLLSIVECLVSSVLG